jgi:hypothetical protein
VNSRRFTVVVLVLGAVAIAAIVLANSGLSFGGRRRARSEQVGDALALTRTPNFGAAMGMLERRRRQVEGVFESLRVAPGRVDTVIVHPDDRRTNIQVRPDMEIAFDSTHDFPTSADFRKRAAREHALRSRHHRAAALD